MNHYRGQVRRQADHTPTKTSWQNEKNNFQQVQQQKYSKIKDYQKSQLSYYQSQVSHTLYQNNQTQSQRQTQKSRTALTINNQNKQLYDNLIPIKIQSTDKEQYSTYLRVQIVNTLEKGMNKLTLYLTDDRDPKFLWLFFIKENDFMILKKQQKLRVDFRGFPAMLMDHFDMCKSQKQAANSINLGQCYFFSLFQMKKSQGSLNILQANKYKQSVHLSLKCKLGNDQQIKQYLSQKLLKSQTQNISLRSTISNLQQTLSTRKQQISRIQIQLKQQQKTIQKSSQQYEMEISRIRTDLKKEMIENQERVRRSNEKEFKEMKQSLEEQLNKYIRSYEELKDKYELAQEKVATYESKQRQTNFDLSTKTKQIESYLKRLQQLKKYTTSLQSTQTQNQKTIIQQKVRIQSLQSQISDKLKIIESHSQLKSTNSHQITSLQSKSQQYKSTITKQQTKITSLQNQLSKIQSLLQDYREKYDKKKQKNQEKNNIIKQQQRYINQKQNQLYDIKRQLLVKEKLVEERRLDVEERDRKIGQLKRQIEECQRKIKEDNDLTIHLQKQLNERTIGVKGGYGTGYGTTSAFQRSTSPFNSNASREYIGGNGNNSTSMLMGGGGNNLNNLTNNNNTSTSTSRLKFTSTGDNNEEVDKGSRKEIQIKRYTTSGNQQRSKSPVLNSRLNQQKDPEEIKSTSNIVKPVKFKFSQRQ